jgi:drug/metabolite transporter (DMT)-like permease
MHRSWFFNRNLVGCAFSFFSFFRYPVKQSGGRFGLLMFRGIMGTLALYTLFVQHHTYSAGRSHDLQYHQHVLYRFVIMVAVERKLNTIAWICIIGGFTGILLIYKPSADFSWKYHAIGLLHGLFSAVAYLSIGTLNRYYDSRIIVMSFLVSGLLLPVLSMMTGYALQLQHDDFFFPVFRMPIGIDWFYLAGLGISALLGQYFVTKAYSNDKAGIVSAIGYSNIIFGLVIGIMLGDSFPDIFVILGVLIVIGSGVMIRLRRNENEK